jgi:hypothetical protein
LPLHIREEVLWVARYFRKSPLSHEPGGSDIVVEYQNGSVYGYDWIKKPSSYINAILNRKVEDEHDISLNNLDEVEQLNVMRNVVKTIYGRWYDDDDEQKTVPFGEVWNNNDATELPSASLEAVFEKRKPVSVRNLIRPSDVEDDLPF